MPQKRFGDRGSSGDGWSVVRRKKLIAVTIVAAVLAATGIAVAGDKDKPADKPADLGPAPGRIIAMQTAFNPALPGSGEGVRVFTRTVKHMSGGALAIKIIEPGRIAPSADMLDAVVAGDLEAAFTWSGYAAAKAPVFGVFATVPFGPGPEDMTSWMLEGDGSRIHREAYEKLGVTGIPCGIQGVEMTSVARELGTPPGAFAALDTGARRAMIAALGRAFGLEPVAMAHEELLATA